MVKTLISGAHILSMDPDIGDIENGDVLIVDGRIAEVGRGIAADDAVRLDGTGRILIPGFVETHTHLWQTPIQSLAVDCWGGEYFTTVHPVSQFVTPTDLYTATFGGVVELLSHGVTTVFDFCHSIHTPEHADASVDALTRGGIRAVYGYSMRDRPEVADRALRSVEDRMRDARRVREDRLPDGLLVQLAIAMNNIEHVSAEQSDAELGVARALGVTATVHSTLPGQIHGLHERGRLGPDLQWVHAVSASDAELQLLAAEGGSVSVTPESEAMTLTQWPITRRALRAGVPVGLGVDLPSALTGSIPNQARAAVVLDRLLAAHERRVQGHPAVRDGVDQPLTARRALELATREGAASIGLGDVTGSVTPGKAADLVLLRFPSFLAPAGDVAAHVAFQTSRGDVELVMVDGVVRVRDGVVLDVDLARLADDFAAARGSMMRGQAHAG